MAKLTALNRELVERETDEDSKKLKQHLTQLFEGNSLILTKINPLNNSASAGSIEIGGALYEISRPQGRPALIETDPGEEKVAPALRNINAKLGEQLSQKAKELEAVKLGMAQFETRHLEALSVIEEEKVALQKELEQAQEAVKRAEAIATSLNGQAILARQSIEQRDGEIRALQHRILLLESSGCIECESLRKQMDELRAEENRIIDDLREQIRNHESRMQSMENIAAECDIEELKTRLAEQEATTNVDFYYWNFVGIQGGVSSTEGRVGTRRYGQLRVCPNGLSPVLTKDGHADTITGPAQGNLQVFPGRACFHRTLQLFLIKRRRKARETHIPGQTSFPKKAT